MDPYLFWILIGIGGPTVLTVVCGFIDYRLDAKRAEELFMTVEAKKANSEVKEKRSRSMRTDPFDDGSDPSWTLSQLRYLRNYEKDVQREVQETFNLKLHNLSKRLHLDPSWFDHLSDNPSCDCVFSYISESAHVYCNEWLGREVEKDLA